MINPDKPLYLCAHFALKLSSKKKAVIPYQNQTIVFLAHLNELWQFCVSADVSLPLKHKYSPKMGPEIDERRLTNITTFH